jgi:hypothetical protein
MGTPAEGPPPMDHQGAQSQYNNYDPRNGGLSRRATDEAASSSNSLAPYDRTNYPLRSSTDPGDQNQAVTKPKRSGKICGKCGEGLTGQFVRALGDTFHLECFTCHVRHPMLFLGMEQLGLCMSSCPAATGAGALLFGSDCSQCSRALDLPLYYL